MYEPCKTRLIHLISDLLVKGHIPKAILLTAWEDMELNAELGSIGFRSFQYWTVRGPIDIEIKVKEKK